MTTAQGGAIRAMRTPDWRSDLGRRGPTRARVPAGSNLGSHHAGGPGARTPGWQQPRDGGDSTLRRGRGASGALDLLDMSGEIHVHVPWIACRVRPYRVRYFRKRSASFTLLLPAPSGAVPSPARHWPRSSRIATASLRGTAGEQGGSVRVDPWVQPTSRDPCPRQRQGWPRKVVPLHPAPAAGNRVGSRPALPAANQRG
jgi:hypothetical protein